jgi:hypothetical protein
MAFDNMRGSNREVAGDGLWPGYDDLTVAGVNALSAEIDDVEAQIAAADTSLDYHEARTLQTTLTPGAATAEMAADSEERFARTFDTLEELEEYLGHLQVILAGVQDGSDIDAARWFTGLTSEN